METRITATELARNLPDVLNRVRDKGEIFVVEQDGEVVAEIAPSPEASKVFTVADFRRKFGDRFVPAGIADAIEEGRKALRMMPEPPW
jgi:antitoxin (DNA-binding transcriptional repressor) of toxin-antitoxin stability system